MRIGSAILSLVCSLFSATANAAPSDREWQIGTSAGVLSHASALGGPGRSASLSAATPRESWFALGSRATLLLTRGSSGPTAAPEIAVSADASRAVMVTTTFRAQSPALLGIAPFVESETGLAWQWRGDRRESLVLDPSRSWRTSGQHVVGLTTSAALGMRANMLGSWPDLELAFRHISLPADDGGAAQELRLGLLW